MTWRDEQVAQTRQAIIESFKHLSSRPGAKTVTIAEVAHASGISPATIYRHFPNRAALVAEASIEDMYVGVDEHAQAWGVNELRTHLEVLWTSFDDNPAWVREAVTSEAGNEMRRVRWDQQRQSILRGLAAAGVPADGSAARHFVVTAGVLSSAHAYLDLRDRHGLGAREAAGIMAWAIGHLAEAVGADPASLWKGEP